MAGMMRGNEYGHCIDEANKSGQGESKLNEPESSNGFQRRVLVLPNYGKERGESNDYCKPQR